MSQILEDSPKHCANGQGLNIDHKLYKKLFFALFTFFLSILSLIFLIWLILHPTKPEFSLKNVDVYQLNISAPHILNSSIHLTFLSKNPNKKVGIYYDELHVFASYKIQQITFDTSLPPFYQGHEDSSILTAGLSMAPNFGYDMESDQSAGKMVLSLKMNGKVRYKVGTWVSGRYKININCIAIMPFGPGMAFGPLSSKQGTQCSTIV